MELIKSSLIFTFIISMSSVEALNCALCYSQDIDTLNLWSLIDVTNKDALKTAATDCTTGFANTPGTTFTQSCSTFCVTYGITNPNGAALVDGTAGTVYTVRGCWDTLFGTIDSAATTWVATSKCQSGTVQSWSDTQAKFVNKFEYLKTCKDTDYCNQAKITTGTETTGTCTDTYTTTKQTCQQCYNNDTNCFSSSCTGQWCAKTETQINGKYTYQKRCAAVNPYGTAKCQSSTYSSALPTRSYVSVTANKCYCNDKANCNSASSTLASLGLIAFAILIVKRTV